MLVSLMLQAAQQPGFDYSSLILFAAMGLVFYFFMIRPQQKKQKEQKKFRDELKKGDSVVTIGGLHGRVYAVDAETITLDVDKGIKLVFEKSAISQEASKKVKVLPVKKQYNYLSKVNLKKGVIT
jgi:preprotein translocase subunit YajC